MIKPIKAMRTPPGRGVSVRKTDVWIVSYPKSGNTWTRFLIAGLVKKEDVNFKNIESVVPDIYQMNRVKLSMMLGTRYIKSHEYYDSRYRRVILIVRDPRDVVLSYFNHFKKMDKNKITEFNEFLEHFLDGSVDNYGDWGSNVNGWLEASEENGNIIIVRYEDLIDDGFFQLRRVAKFLGLIISDSKIQNIVEKYKFEKMRELERMQGKYWKPIVNSKDEINFVRRGKVNGWKEELTENQVKMINDRFSKPMKKLGYI